MTPSAIETEFEQEFRNTPIELIRTPESPVRETMDDQKFLELCESVAAVGLIEPIVLKDCNEYFEVIAGDRRLRACRAVGLKTVPSVIRRNAKVSNLAIMIHENACREDMNPVEEGRFYAVALDEECGGDVDKLCDMLKRDRAYVEGRILLLTGYPKVLEALEAKLISIAVSKLLNKVKDPNRMLLLLDQAVQGGVTAKLMAEWVRDANGLEPIQLPPADPEADALLAAQLAAAAERTCFICQSNRHANAMRSVWMHDVCADNFADAQGIVNQNDPV